MKPAVGEFWFLHVLKCSQPKERIITHKNILLDYIQK